jgi:EmrB/QacA subfamily drug resistance transporter
VPIFARSTAVLAAILTCQLMVILDGTVVNIALPHIQAALGFSSTDLSWVLNAYTLAFGGFLLLGARAGDLLGRRRVLIIGIAVFTLSSLLAGVASTSGVLLAARATQGLGGALAAPSALALLTVSFKEGPPRTRALAWYTAVVVGGNAVGLIVGGMLVQWVSWRWIFFINLPIGVALISLGRRVLPETQHHPGKVDVGGALTSIVGMSAIVYGLVRAPSQGWAEPTTIAPLAIGSALMLAFIGIETRVATPITPLRLFADRPRSSSYVVRLLLVASMFGTFFFLSQFLQEVLGYSPLRTGAAFVPMTVALFAGSQLSVGLLARWLPDKTIMLCGLTLSAAGMLYLTQLSQHSTYPALLASLMGFGLGNGLAVVPLSTLSLAGVKHQDAGAASGLINACQQIGGTMGLAILVTVFGAASHAHIHHLPASLTPHARTSAIFAYGADWTFSVAATFIIVSFAIVATLKMPSRRQPNPHREPEPEIEATSGASPPL